ncbi:uncharacterized protein MELLADRAFT_59749 [Melampsora larici-populina 98AG31]|uniref:Ubiquitin-like-conjugating enzyme ATG10 n=1 Tax=Melampsora larici-populina (strain 98AG31 / pathotype 3-4-7) TaxID=747676 RepID=F4R753_MELLP|nr:uncharacterized protein MELLADRAFT_59749 [Melampsora larici-populina 98AG31]EGG11526.1 hypothetical protein MELLADRAFT_59749 [Melampsora larici-populina 98AG31]
MSMNLSRKEFEESCNEFLTFWNSPQNQNDQSDFNSHHFLKGWKRETHPMNDRFGYLVSEALDRILNKKSFSRNQDYESSNEQNQDEISSLSSQLISESFDEELQDIEIPVELEDESILSTSSGLKTTDEPMIIKFQTWIVYSETYRVPHFLFNAYKSDGTSLTLEELMRSNIFNPQTSHLSFVDDHHTEELSNPNLVDLEYPFNTLERSAKPKDEDQNVILPFMTQVEHPFTQIPVWSLHPCNTAAVLEEMLTGCMDKLNSRVTIEAFLTLVNGLINLRRSSN